MGVIAAALITMGIPLGLAIEDPHHPPATSAPHQASQKCASPARRFTRAVLLHVRVFQQQLLIGFVLLPADIAGMIVAQENIPFLPWFFEPADLAGATVHDPCLLSDSAKRIGASIERIVQNLHHRVIGRRLPAELVDLNVPQDHRYLNVGSAQPKKGLPGAAELAELREDESNHSRHMFVGIDFDLAEFIPAKSWWKHEAVLAALGLGVSSGDSTLTKQAQLILRHRSLQSEKQAVVDKPRIVSPIGIDDQRAREGA